MADAYEPTGSPPPSSDRETPRARSAPAIAAAEFVSRLVSDPASPPETTLLTGYPGASDEENHTRIYFDPELRDYVDVANDDILHTQPGEGGALEPSLVWIRREAQVLHGAAAGDRQRAGFFEGRVWQDNFASTAEAAAGAAGAGAAAATIGIACRPSLIRCPLPSRIVICRTSNIVCPRITREIRCPVASPWCGPLPWTWVDPNITETLGNPTIGQQRGGFGAFDDSGEGDELSAKFRPRPPGGINVFGASDWGTDTVHQGSGDWTDTVAFGGADTVSPQCFVNGPVPQLTQTIPPRCFVGGTPPHLFPTRNRICITRFHCPIPTGHNCPSFGFCPSVAGCPSVGFCPTDTIATRTIVENQTIFQQRGGFGAFEGSDFGTDTVHQGSGDWTDTVNFGDAGFGGGATAPSIAIACGPSAFIACRPSIFCQTRDARCIITHDARCFITRDPARCPIHTGFACPTMGPCPSIAGCPSVGFCPTDTIAQTRTIVEHQTILRQRGGFGAFEGSDFGTDTVYQGSGDWGTDTVYQGSGDWTDTVAFGGAAQGPSLAFACQPTLACPIATHDVRCVITRDARCIVTRDARCVFTADPRRCPIHTGFACPTMGPCPSIAGCPSAGFCPTDTIAQTRTIVRQPGGFGAFEGGPGQAAVRNEVITQFNCRTQFSPCLTIDVCPTRKANPTPRINPTPALATPAFGWKPGFWGG